MRSSGDALDCRKVGIVGETKDEELLRAATNCGTECMAEGQKRRGCPGRDQKDLPRMILRG